MINRISWEEFRDNKMLWFVNTFLHAFGLSIVVEINDDEKIADVYPARVGFRGFTEDINTEGYIGISEYMKNNAEELWKEAKD